MLLKDYIPDVNKKYSETFFSGISFNSSELKVSSFRVSVIRQKLIDNNWVEDGSSDALARKIEDLILSRARELRRS